MRSIVEFYREIIRGRADKFCLHLNRKRTGKKYFNDTKKKYAYVSYFQSCIIIFLQNHHAGLAEVYLNTLQPTLH